MVSCIIFKGFFVYAKVSCEEFRQFFSKSLVCDDHHWEAASRGGGLVWTNAHNGSALINVGHYIMYTHPLVCLCVSEFVPTVCQLMLNTGTPNVDTGADLRYMADQPKMSLPCTHTPYECVQICQNFLLTGIDLELGLLVKPRCLVQMHSHISQSKL